MKVKLPFGTGAQALELSDECEILRAQEQPAREAERGADIVKRAMAHPAGGAKLWRLAQDKRRAVLIVSDHTRPVPSKDIVPAMLAEMRRGNPGIDITLLVATGLHRGTTARELKEKLGDEVCAGERIVVHDCMDEGNLVSLGRLPSGAELVINRLAAEADLLVAEGFIEPHFFAGYSGGRKSVLPGICGRKTVLMNHSSAFIADANARAGVLAGNPIQRDMEAAVAMARLAYVVNVTIDAEKRTAAAFAGDAIKAHAEGCAHLAEHCVVRPRRRGDIVVSTNGGMPLDQNLYQAVKGLSTAEAAAAPDAVLILCAECSDGVGGQSFYEALRQCDSPARLLEQIVQTPMEETRPDQWQYQILARILSKHRVIMVTQPAIESEVRAMKMDWAPTAQAALETARRYKPDGHAVVIPDGVGVIVEV